MFKVKISVLYFLLVFILGGSSYIYLTRMEAAHDTTLKRGAEYSYRSFDRLQALERHEMRFIANRITRSALGVYLGVVQQYRNKLTQIRDEINKQKLDGDKAEAYVTANHHALITEMAKQMIDGTHGLIGGVEYTDAAQRVEQQRKLYQRLVRCIPRNDDDCLFQFTYYPLTGGEEKDFAGGSIVDAVFRSEARPDLLIVADGRGVALCNTKDGKWHRNRQRVTTFSRQVPAVLKVRDRNVYHGVYYWRIRKFFYFIAVSPMYYRGSFVGSLVYGRLISKDMLKRQASVVGRMLAYIYQGTIVMTSVDGSAAHSFIARIWAEVSAQMAKEGQTQGTVSGDDYLAYAISMSKYITPLRTDAATKQTRPVPLHYLLILDRRVANAEIASKKNWILALSVLVFLVGFFIIHFLINQYTAVFKQIDQGIHELISGNNDYQFPFDYQEELPNSMAQSLNIMVALLLGRPIPEDEDAVTEEWAAELFAGAQTAPDESGEIAIDSRQISALTTEDELKKESAELYYKRIYNEYIQAREQLGLPSEKVTYMKFIEKLVKNEALLKKKYRCRAIRFAVVIKDDKVTLKPVQINS